MMDEEQQQDLSPKTIFVLVVLTLVVSFIGAYVSVTASLGTPVQQEQVVNNPTSQAHVSFEITGPNTDQSTGMVALEIAPSAG